MMTNLRRSDGSPMAAKEADIMIALVCDRCSQVTRRRTEVESTTKVSLSTAAGVCETRHLCKDYLEAFELFLQDYKNGGDGHGV